MLVFGGCRINCRKEKFTKSIYDGFCSMSRKDKGRKWDAYWKIKDNISTC